MKELCCRLRVERNPLTAYHSQTNGQTEWVNQELEQYLRLYCNYQQNDWAEWLSIAEFVTNFIQSYLHQFFDDSHSLKTSLKPLKRPFDRYKSHFKAINNGRDFKQINW